MVQQYINIINTWSIISSVLCFPQNESDINRLIDFSDYLIDLISGDGNHPLMELLNIVGTIISDYENKNIVEPEGTPIGCLKYLMKEHGLKHKDLKELGSPGEISEILSEKRELNKRQIKALCNRFKCNPAIFI